jgi:hypothetical protein
MEGLAASPVLLLLEELKGTTSNCVPVGENGGL